jgi:hypothetical protein
VGGIASFAVRRSSMHAASIKEDNAQGCDVHYRAGSASPVSRARLIGKHAEKLERQHTAAMCRACVFIHTQPLRQGPAIFTSATGISSLKTVLKFSRLQIFWQGFLKQLLIDRENADTQHLDTSPSVIHLLLKNTNKRFFKTASYSHGNRIHSLVYNKATS